MPPRSEPLRILSLGGGIQSSGLLLMSASGVLPKLDAAIFADTRHEMPETYAYLDMLESIARGAGIPLQRVSAGDLKAAVFERAGRGSQPQLPIRVRGKDDKLQRINGYTCSFDFKRRVVDRFVKKSCGKRGAWKRTTVEQWIGYSTDEHSRRKPSEQCRCGHNRTVRTTKAQRAADPDLGTVSLIHVAGQGCLRCACAGFDPWQMNTWPLIDPLRMSRRDVVRWITEHGYPEPPRSACYFCPNRGNAHWRELRQNRPLLWASAVELDEFLRHGSNGLRGEGFIHQSGVPLAEADLRPAHEVLQEKTGQLSIFAAEVDADCDAGVCFT